MHTRRARHRESNRRPEGQQARHRRLREGHGEGPRSDARRDAGQHEEFPGSTTHEEQIPRSIHAPEPLGRLDHHGYLAGRAHVAGELAAYAPLVERGSYIIVQDTPAGPMGAIEEFIANTDRFVIDRSRERYPDTHSIKGYLKRVRD